MIFDIYAEKENRNMCIYSTSSPVQQTALIDPLLHIEVDTAGTLEFGIPYTNHVLINNYGTRNGFVERMVTKFFVYRTLTKPTGRTRKVIWSGRALTTDYDFYNTPSVHCEGALSFFNDTIQDKVSFVYVDSSETNPTLEDILRRIISVHNSKCPMRAFQLPPDDVQLVHGFEGTELQDNPFYITNKNTFEVLTDLKSKYGGHFRVVYDEIPVSETDPTILANAKVPKLEWYATYNKSEDDEPVQTVSFADNLVDITRQLNGESIVNAVFPIGKVINKGGAIAAKRRVPITCYHGEYALTTERPSDWDTEYWMYFTLERHTYMQVPRTYKVPEWKSDTYYSAKIDRYHVNESDLTRTSTLYGDKSKLWADLLYKTVDYYKLNESVEALGYRYRGAFRSVEELSTYFGDGEGQVPVKENDLVIICSSTRTGELEQTLYKATYLYRYDGTTWEKCEHYGEQGDTKPSELNDIYTAGKFVINNENHGIVRDQEHPDDPDWSHWYFRKDCYYGSTTEGFKPSIDAAMNVRLRKDVNSGTSRPAYGYVDSISAADPGAKYYISAGGYWDSDQCHEDGFIHDNPDYAFEVQSGETYYVHTRIGASTIPWALTQWYLGRYPHDENWEVVYHDESSRGIYFRSLSTGNAMAANADITDIGYTKVEVGYPSQPLVDNNVYLERLYFNVCSMNYMEDPWGLASTGLDIIETRKVPDNQDEHITMLGVDDGSAQGYIREVTGVDAYLCASPALPQGWDPKMETDYDALGSLKLNWFIEPGYVRDGWFPHIVDQTILSRFHQYASMLNFPEEGSLGHYYMDLSTGKVYIWIGERYSETDTVKTYKKENFYVVDKESEEKYGRIEKLLEFDDVEDPETLKKLAAHYLYTGQFEALNIEITALDLAIFKDRQVDTPDILDGIHVFSPVHDVNLVLPVKSRDIPLNKLEDMTWELGYEATRQISSKGR